MDEQAVESNDTLQSLVDAAEPTLGEGEFFLSDGIKGVGDQPEWYKADKYKSVAEQAKAYTELEKKFGGFTGAPKDGYSIVEGVESDDALWQELVSFGEKTNMSQSAMNDAWDLLSAQDQAAEEVSMEVELQKLGDNGVERVKVVEQYMKNNLDGDTYERLRYAVNSAEAVELIEALVKSTAPAKLPIDGYIEPGGLTWEDIESEMYKKSDNGQYLRSVDPNHEAKIQRMMKEFGGDKPNVRVVG